MKALSFALATLFLLLTLCACTPDTGSDDSSTGAPDTTLEETEEATEATTTDETDTELSVDTTTTDTEGETSAPEETTTEAVTMPTLDTLPFYDGENFLYQLQLPAEDVLAGNQADYDFLKNAISDLCGAPIPECADDAQDTLYIGLSLSGEAMDYSVVIEGTGTVTLTGGSKETLQRAIYTFTGSFLHVNTDGSVDLIHTGDFIYDYSEDQIDNSDLLSYIPTDEVTLQPSNTAGTLLSPEWVESLVMVEVRIDKASIGGTFQESYDLLDHYASMGVNGIWLTPIYDFGSSNGYGNNGPHTVAPHLTGTTDYAEGWQVVKEFVDYAHSKGIYIFLDVITWGANKDSPLVADHPDWFSGEAWGNAAFNWKNQEFVEWFKQTCVTNILTTGADGFRCDCEPLYTGYEVFEDIRNRLAAEGKHVMIMAEDQNLRGRAYDMEQDGVIVYQMSRGELYTNGYNFFVDGFLDIVRVSTTGRGLASGGGNYRFYTNCISNHDWHLRGVQGNRLKIGYAAILAPYIPLWYQGEEFNATTPGIMYDNGIDHGELEIPANALFFEDVKAMIRIRRTYSDLFEYWPLKHTDTNLCGVTVNGWNSTDGTETSDTSKIQTDNPLSAYARYLSPEGEGATPGQAILVIPNHVSTGSAVGTVTIPVEEANLSGYTYFTITDLSTGRVIAHVPADAPTFTVTIPYNYAGMYLVQGV